MHANPSNLLRVPAVGVCAPILAAHCFLFFGGIFFSRQSKGPNQTSYPANVPAVEVCAPILAASTLALAPKAADALQSKLPEWGLDADGLNRRMDAIVEARSRGKE
jgi:hypothetical protein